MIANPSDHACLGGTINDADCWSCSRIVRPRKQAGRPRSKVCIVGHELTDSNRRWVRKTRKDGTTTLRSNGCRECTLDRAREQYENKTASRMDEIALRLMGRAA